MRNVLWFSCGVSSAIVAWLCKDELHDIIYCHVDDQHEDSLRFLHDIEKLIGREITILQAPEKDVDAVCRKTKSITLLHYAACTNVLKKQVRVNWQNSQPIRNFTYFWGMDCNETDRAKRLPDALRGCTSPATKHRFPLIEKNLSKQDCHAMMKRLGVKRPTMYDLGYNNNNCIGCLKGGMGYWNKIRVDFPDVFASRAKLERDIGHSCIKGVFLDELDPEAGRNDKPIDMSCGIICEIALMEEMEREAQKDNDELYVRATQKRGVK